MIGIDLFAGAGGMSLGATNVGVKIALAVESDTNAALTYQHNHPSTALFNNDIRRLSASRLKKIKRGSNGTIVFGGPPCQGFSYSNSRTRSRANPDNWLFKEFLRIVHLWEPDVVVFENVRGIVTTEGGVFLAEVITALTKLRYSIAHGLLNAKYFGVPQDRARFFLLATRQHGVPLTLPTRSDHATVSVWDAIHDLPRLSNGANEDRLPYRAASRTSYARRMRRDLQEATNHLVTRNAEYVITRYKHIPQGGNWEDIPAPLMRNYADRSRCHTGIYHRLRANQPSVVIGNFRKNMLIHPYQHRGLSVREAARIQSFPDWYTFHGSVGFQQQQVGNAVPPLLAEAVFHGVLNPSKEQEPA